MANVNRYRKGALTLINVPVASATVIEIGDFICLSAGKAVPPSGIAVASTSRAATRDACADVFIGIAHSASANGETDDILVDISLESQYEINLAATSALSIGDGLEIYAEITTSVCEDQKMVAGATDPVMVCVRDSATSTTHIAKMCPSVLMHPKQS